MYKRIIKLTRHSQIKQSVNEDITQDSFDKLARTGWRKGLSMKKARFLLSLIVRKRQNSRRKFLNSQGGSPDELTRFIPREKHFMRLVFHALVFMVYLKEFEGPPSQLSIASNVLDTVKSINNNVKKNGHYKVAMQELFKRCKPILDIMDIGITLTYIGTWNSCNLSNQLTNLLRNKINQFDEFSMHEYAVSTSQPGMLDEHTSLLHELHFGPFIARRDIRRHIVKPEKTSGRRR